MRKRLWFSLGVALLVYVSWAAAQGMALRTRSPIDPNNSMSRLIALEIDPRYDVVEAGEYAHIVVTIRNITAQPIQIASRAAKKHPAAELFRWNVERPDGGSVKDPKPQELLATYENRDIVLQSEYLPTWLFGPDREILEAGAAQSFYLTAPMGFPGTEGKGDYRISLTYAVTAERASKSLPDGYWKRFAEKNDAPLAVGLIRSNEIVVTRE